MPPPNSLRRRTRTEWRIAAAAAVTVTLFATAFPAITVALENYSPAPIAYGRFMIAAVAMTVISAMRESWSISLRDLPAVSLVGLAGMSYHLLLNKGQQTITPATASVLIAMGPVFTVYLSALILRERLRAQLVIGLLIAFTGVTIIASPGRTDFHVTFSTWLIVAAALAQALFIVIQKPLLRKYSPVSLTTASIVVTTVLLAPFFVADTVTQIRNASTRSTVALVYTALGSTTLGTVAWAYVLRRIPASRATMILYLVPAVATLTAWAWLGQVPAWRTVLGGLIILAGVTTALYVRQTAPSEAIEQHTTALGNAPKNTGAPDHTTLSGIQEHPT